jgi:hypothetical protein
VINAKAVPIPTKPCSFWFPCSALIVIHKYEKGIVIPARIAGIQCYGGQPTGIFGAYSKGVVNFGLHLHVADSGNPCRNDGPLSAAQILHNIAVSAIDYNLS